MSKILVVRFSSLGDVILTTPVYRNLKSSMPDCYVAVAVKRKYLGVLEKNPYIDQWIVLGDHESLFSLIRKIRREKFDVLIDLHNNLRSNLVAFFSGIPLVVRYRKAFWERRMFVKKRIKSGELKHNVVHRYLETLKPLGVEAKFPAPEVFSEDGGGKTSKAVPSMRILIIQTAFLGDAVLTTPMFDAIRTVYPSAQVSLLCTPEVKEIFSGNKNVHEIYVMDKRGKEGGVFSVFSWGNRLKNRFDIALLPHRSFRSAFLAWLARIPKRVGFENSQGRFFLTDLVSFDWKMHDSERNMKLLEVLGIEGIRPRMKVPAGESSHPFDLFLKKHGLSKESVIIGINPGSMWNTKRWMPDGFAKVADTLIQERKGQVVLFGSEKDAPAVQEVIRRMKSKAINLCGQTDLKTLTHFISRCSLFITNDSGPMHLAAASNVPVVAIFGPTTKELGFFPYGEKSAVVEIDLSCRPCTLHGGTECPLSHFRCMKEITAEQVLKPCRDFLNASGLSGSHKESL